MADTERYVLSFASLRAWCERNEYEHQLNEEVEQLAIKYGLMEMSAPLMIIPQWDRGIVVFAMRQPYRVPADRVAEVLTATNRLNAMSFLGAWSLNADELIFRVAAVVEDIEYTDTAMLAIVRSVVGNSESATATLHSIAIEGVAAETALAALIQ